MNVPLWRPSQLQSKDTFEAEMSPTLKLIREAAKQRLTVGGVWMKAESLPGGFSTTARKKTHSTSKHTRSSAVATPHLHCCLNATSAFNTAALFDCERRDPTVSLWDDDLTETEPAQPCPPSPDRSPRATTRPKVPLLRLSVSIHVSESAQTTGWAVYRPSRDQRHTFEF